MLTLLVKLMVYEMESLHEKGYFLQVRVGFWIANGAEGEG